MTAFAIAAVIRTTVADYENDVRPLPGRQCFAATPAVCILSIARSVHLCDSALSVWWTNAEWKHNYMYKYAMYLRRFDERERERERCPVEWLKGQMLRNYQGKFF